MDHDNSSAPERQDSDDNWLSPIQAFFGSKKGIDALTASFTAITTVITTTSLFRTNVVRPFTDPVTLKIEKLDIATNSTGNSSSDIPVTISGVIKNTGLMSAWLLKAHWVLIGSLRTNSQAGKSSNSMQVVGSTFTKQAIDEALRSDFAMPKLSIDSQDLSLLQEEIKNSDGKPSAYSSRHLLGISPLGPDLELQPNQEVRFKRVLYTPKSLAYSYIEARVSLPTLRKSNLLRQTTFIGYQGCVTRNGIFCESPPGKVLNTSSERRLENISWNSVFCQHLPFGNTNRKPKLRELGSLFEMSPYYFSSNSLAGRYCGNTVIGLSPALLAKYGASVITVVHEEPLASTSSLP